MIRACRHIGIVLVALVLAAAGPSAAGSNEANEALACEAPDPRPSLKLDEAARAAVIAACRAALAADPSSASIRSALAVHLYRAGDYAGSFRLAREAADMGMCAARELSDATMPGDWASSWTTRPP